MEIELYNLTKFLRLEREGGIKNRIKCLDEGEKDLFKFLFILLGIPFFGILFVLFFAIVFDNYSFSKKDVHGLLILSSFGLIILILFISIAIIFLKNVFSGIKETNKNCLNEVFVDPDNKNKVYLLHELIEKHGLKKSKKNQEDKEFLYLYLNTNVKYKCFDEYEYSDDDTRDILLNQVIPYKELSENEMEQFFIKYIDPYIFGEKRSFEEKEQLLKNITKLNNVKL